MALSKQDPIVIVGAGVFGLSTAIHLAERGYSNVTVIDKQDYTSSLYSYDKGCDAASADINKIIRCAYGTQTEYQSLSIEALKSWNAWNHALSTGTCVPPGLTRTFPLFTQNGNLQITDQPTLPPFERASIHNMTAANLGPTQIITNNPAHIAHAAATGLSPTAIDPFRRQAQGKPYLALLDSTGGTAHADHACRFALHRAQQLGVNFILGHPAGTFASFLHSDPADPAALTGLTTADGVHHHAKLTLVAAGGWTPSLVPELDGLCETTAGSVALIPIPPSSPLRKRLSIDNFPTWTYKMRDGPMGGLYGFALSPESGVLKVGYRGTKYTNPILQPDGKERSVPLTRWTSPASQSLIPKQALSAIKAFLTEFLPELAAEGIRIAQTRLCWYCDSFDNHFVVDRVPGRRGLMVATGGSGHAFMFFPNLGRWVVDVIEGVGMERELVRKWAWRSLKKGETPVNVLMEGSSGPRALGNVELCSEADFGLGDAGGETGLGVRSKL